MERPRFLEPPHDSVSHNGRDSDVDSVESPMLHPRSPLSMLFNSDSRYSLRDRQPDNLESRRSSNSSVDMSFVNAIRDKDRSNIPRTERDIEDLVKDLSESYRRSFMLKEALKTSWAWTMSDRCFESGNNILHVAAKLGEYKLAGILTGLCLDVDGKNCRGDTAMHLAAEFGHSQVIDTLMRRGANKELSNNLNFKPLQVAAIKCHAKCLEVLIKYDPNYRILTDQKETLIHLACRASFSRLLAIKEEVNDHIGGIESYDEAKSSSHYTKELERRQTKRENELYAQIVPVFELLLAHFRRSPDLLELEDKIPTSPGTILHYFAALNLVAGTKVLLLPPFRLDPNTKNKNQFTPLVIAAFYNHITLSCVLLDHKANPNAKDPNTEDTPLHFAIYGYHIDRVEETCRFIEKLLHQGADPKMTSKSGEAPMHMVIGTLDFRLMVQFLDYLGPESLEMRDDNGNTLFHHAVASLDENSIVKFIEMGANLMNKTRRDVQIEEDPDAFTDFSGDDIRPNGLTEHIPLGTRTSTMSVSVQRLPLQEAMQAGNSATREVRPDIVRILFHHVDGVMALHRLLLFCDKSSEDETFTKTALEWAVENNDRLCTTEILHQEFHCHKEDKRAGLTCLRRQLRGDELLIWTIETFTMFYERTFAQRTVIPMFGLLPLLLSIFTFVFDYYSDIDLIIEYYLNSTFAVESVISEPRLGTNGSTIRQGCHDIDRTPEEFTTAFVTNLTCLCIPLVIFLCMCSRELWPYFQILVQYLNRKWPRIPKRGIEVLAYIMWMTCSTLCAPFFILYVAFRNVYYKFRHQRATRKNLFRKQLQKSEYLWGISRTAEAGLESCGQLVLQVWLLSSDFKFLNDNDFWTLVDKTYNGIIFFLTFSYKPADDIEKSLGKLLMSLIALVFGVSGCYRSLKRGAVKMSNTYFIYASLLCQIFARIFSIGLFFFAVRQFYPIVPILLVCHLSVVFIIKWTFERARHTQGMLAWLVSLVNVVASSLVYVRIVPIDKQRPSKWRRETTNFLPSHAVLPHSTFFVQTLFFVLVLVENILLASTPLMYPSSRAHVCLGTAKLVQYIFIVIGLCLGSWVCHAMYYKYMGHPWSDINGPDVSSGGLKFSLHVCGKEKFFQCSCRGGNDFRDREEYESEELVECQCSSRCRVQCTDFKDDGEDSDDFKD
eukprot:maker-scaffold276_size226481-snap-gene-0.17 protein:Tk04696 transcript:maker-scaffold276_size226481-snap-gene-0.17-mRNA-1 annotation:"hypothetical protein"